MRGTKAKELREKARLAARIDRLERQALRRERQADELQAGLLQLQLDIAASLNPGEYRRPDLEDRPHGRGHDKMQSLLSARADGLEVSW